MRRASEPLGTTLRRLRRHAGHSRRGGRGRDAGICAVDSTATDDRHTERQERRVGRPALILLAPPGSDLQRRDRQEHRLVLYVVSIVLMFILIGFLTTPALWIWGMVDAYRTAERLHQQAGLA